MDATPATPLSTKFRNFGVLLTGYIDKKNPYGGYRKRFVVLTQESIHWYDRSEDCDLFGHERGHIQLKDVRFVKPVANDSRIFELDSPDHPNRLFRAPNLSNCEEWIREIECAVKAIKLPNDTPVKREKAIRNYHARLDQSESGHRIVLASVKSRTSEFVISHTIEKESSVCVALHDGDDFVVSMGSGASATIPLHILRSKAQDSKQFEVSIVKNSIPLRECAIFSARTSGMHNDEIPVPSSSAHTPSNNFISLIQLKVVLPVLVLLVGIAFAPSLNGWNFILLYVLSITLAIYCLVKWYYGDKDDAVSKLPITSTTYSYSITFHGFGIQTADTSPTVVPTDDPSVIPKRFVDGCNGDMVEARRRWEITCRWRQEEVSGY